VPRIAVAILVCLFLASCEDAERVSGRRGCSNARRQIKEFDTAIRLYHMEFGRYPDSLDQLTTTALEGTEEPFLEDIPLDPWDEEFLYDPAGGTKRLYLLTSRGEDRKLGTQDDITSEDVLR
jgi:hypothetical protein